MIRSQLFLRSSCLVFGALIVSGLPVSAHPGHDFLAHGPLHPLLSPYHFVGLLLLGTLCLVAGRILTATRAGRRLAWAGRGCLFAAAGVGLAGSLTW